jgi:hypothetical protein
VLLLLLLLAPLPTVVASTSVNEKGLDLGAALLALLLEGSFTSGSTTGMKGAAAGAACTAGAGAGGFQQLQLPTKACLHGSVSCEVRAEGACSEGCCSSAEGGGAPRRACWRAQWSACC